MAKQRAFNTITIKKADIERRELEGGKRVLIGIIPYNSPSENLGGFVETIKETAFKRTIANTSDVKALWAHNSRMILGRVKNNTLKLEDAPEGLRCTVELPCTSYADDLWELIARDDVRSMSFGFETVKDYWDYSAKPAKRDLIEVKLIEVSFGVTDPAYPETDSATALRSLYAQRGIDLESLGDVMERAAETGYTITEDDKKAINTAIAQLRELIGEPDTRNTSATVEETEHVEPEQSTQPDLLEQELTLRQREAQL